jgi:predicted metal-dependent phosphoesterase TrpH
MGKADLHIHTSFSDGMASAREVLDWTEQRTVLDAIAITDHDDATGALRAREVWAKGAYRFDFIVGVEITTIEGHLLGLFVEEPLPNLCHVEDAVEAVRKQGGVCVAPHPLNWLTRSLGVRELRRVSGLSGLELTNCSPGSRLRRAKAAALNRTELRLAEIGGSDAHFPDFIGGAYTEFEGTTAAELKTAIIERKTRARRGARPSLWDIGPRRLAQQGYRGIMTTPRRMGWAPTARSFIQRVFR